MRPLIIVSCVGFGLFLTLAFGLFTITRLMSSPVSPDEISGVYEAAGGSILNQSDAATLTLNRDHSFTQTVRLKNGESRESKGTYKIPDIGSGGIIEFFDFDLLPSFGEGDRTDHWAVSPNRTLLGRVQFCYDSDTGYCYVKKP